MKPFTKSMASRIREPKVATQEIKASNEDSKVGNASLKSLCSATRKKCGFKKMMKSQGENGTWEHNKWMRDHEVRLRTQYKMIRK